MNVEKKSPVVATILAGGTGIRLWPLSTKQRPKQLLSLDNKETLLENTIDRAQHITPHWHIVAAKQQAHFFKKHAESLKLEPAPKNTAAALLLSALTWYDSFPNAILCSFPADHTINDQRLWQESITHAIEYSQNTNEPVLLGIKPTYAAPWYGYIIYDHNNISAHRIQQFIEKPTTPVAATLIENATVMWNSGILITPIERLIKAFQEMHPQLFAVVQEYKLTGNDALYNQLPSLSLDTALLERGYCSTLFEMHGGWSDVGNFETFHAAQKMPSTTIQIQSQDNTVISTKPTILVDVHDLHVIETDSVLLIMHKKPTHTMHDIIEEIRSTGLEHLL